MNQIVTVAEIHQRTQIEEGDLSKFSELGMTQESGKKKEISDQW